MAKERLKRQYAQKSALLLPRPEKLITVSIEQWNRYMDRIRECNDSSHSYESLGYACVGIAISFLIAAITFPFSVEFSRKLDGSTQANLPAITTEVACVAIPISTGVLSIYSFRFASQHRKDRETIRQVIVEDMQAHADRFPLIDEPTMP